jgi:DNA replication protein DnaC
MPSQISKTCPDCKRPLWIQEGKEFCFQCDVIAKEDKRLAAQAVEQYERMKFDRVQEFFNSNSLINPKLLRATFESYNPRHESQAAAKKACMKYARNFAINLEKENDVGLLLFGGYGLGKSHLAVSVLKTVMQQRRPGSNENIRAIYINLPKLKTKIKESWGKESALSEAKIIEALETVELLVLDELGGEFNKKDEQGNSFFNDIIYQIIDARQGRNTIYTSNMQPKELEQQYNRKIYERIFANIHLLEFEGSSYRTGGEF